MFSFLTGRRSYAVCSIVFLWAQKFSQSHLETSYSELPEEEFASLKTAKISRAILKRVNSSMVQTQGIRPVTKVSSTLV